ncbi:hypothetical protein H4684_002788 [Desulfomicrobium macestii]|uniref:Uncharacterized protein n=1 Tax=Desulfomicrobium macestii TaxID=90731 RepID=A0ABR9H5Y6_9BACT|nr:hypothetical protein [Desulfomicrobium macestii]
MKIQNSPFKKYEKIVLEKESSCSRILRKAVLSMFDGNAHKFGLSTLGYLNDEYEEIFHILFNHYLIHGESDDDFLELGRQCYHIEIL